MSKIRRFFIWLIGACNYYGHDWARWGVGYSCKRCKKYSDNRQS